MHLTNIYYLHEIGGKKNQEDYIWPVPGSATPEDRIFIVCDGVGGSENGELASMIVSESLAEELKKIPVAALTIETFDGIVKVAKQKLVKYVRTSGLNTDMATTFCLLVLFQDKAFVAWCGDSRVYQVREGETIYKTSDHSLVNTLVRNGEITEEEARSHPQKNIILKAVKADNSIVEYEHHWIHDIEDGDYFMLCTDGVLENIDDKELKELLVSEDKPEHDISQSFQKLCLHKTRDNYSMYLIRVVQKLKKNQAAKSKKYFIGFFLILIIFSIIVLPAYFDKVQTKPLLAPLIESLDSGVANQTFIHSDIDSFPELTKDSGIDAVILKSDEKKESQLPQASSAVIQPVSPPKKIEKLLPSPAKDIAADSIHKLKNSDPPKIDSSRSIKPSK